MLTGEIETFYENRLCPTTKTSERMNDRSSYLIIQSHIALLLEMFLYFFISVFGKGRLSSIINLQNSSCDIT